MNKGIVVIDSKLVRMLLRYVVDILILIDLLIKL